MNFTRKKDFFVGVDSDGTAFDSMTIKHTHAFIPAMVRVWGLEPVAEDVVRTAERINLYSPERGINRFPGLVRTFDELRAELGERFPVKEYEALRRFTDSGAPMSNRGLEAYMAKHPAPVLEQTLRWSRTADQRFAQASENLPPFPGVGPALRSMGETADLMVVSAASCAGLMGDWGRTGLLDTVDFVAGQEFGGKDAQLALALSAGYDRDKCLMIGDGLGDWQAAREAGICFYPVVPSREAHCWKSLMDRYYPMFLAGEYAGGAQDALTAEFEKFLEQGE